MENPFKAKLVLVAFNPGEEFFLMNGLATFIAWLFAIFTIFCSAIGINFALFLVGAELNILSVQALIHLAVIMFFLSCLFGFHRWV
jgi:hypothetical protein